jgi:hypothetical protein
VIKRSSIALAILVLAGALTGAWVIKRRAERSLTDERSRLEKKNIIPFEHKSYSPVNNPAISVWQS